MKSRYFGGVSAVAVALSLGMTATQALAATDSDATVDAVYVTGSLIAGTPEDAAAPVDVVGAEELDQRGSPSVVQFVKTIPSSGAVIGENNRFGGGNGGSTVNLRGLGGTRTLVLFNGRRLPGSPQGLNAVDLNLLPLSAIGRVEVLKDGAAATYGSDAVGGVVNFITRTDLDGLELSADYQFINGSGGDYNVGLVWGNRGDNYTIFASADYRRRSELPVQERDWALRTGVAGYIENPLGGWASTGNPGRYNTVSGAPAGSPNTGFTAFGVSATAGFLQDIGCAANGGAPFSVAGGFPVASGTTCQFQYTTFDNLVEDETHYQGFLSLKVDLSDSVRFFGEVLFARNETPLQSWAMTGPNQYPAPILSSGGSPGGGVSPIPATGTSEQSNFYIPNTNPGLVVLLSQLAAASCAGPVLPYGTDAASCAPQLAAAQAQAASAAANGVAASPTAWRPVGFAGNPYTDDNHSHYTYNTTTFRVVGGFEGDFENGVHWTASATFQELDNKYNLQDISVNRLQLALRGYGSRAGDSNQCTSTDTNNWTLDTAAGNESLGCYYFNPFTNAFAQSTSNVAANPFYAPAGSAAVADYTNAQNARASVVDWMEEEQYNEIAVTLFTVDLVFSGKLPWTLLSDEQVAWAGGVQMRYDRTKQTPDVLYDANATPCVDSPPFGDGTPFCPTTSNGPFLFNANLRPYDVTRKIYAAFGELRLPFTDTLEVTIAGRAESYESADTTFNPKATIRWQATDWLALRGTVGTTYRAPLATTTDSTRFVRGLSNGSGTYRANDLFGNASLQPETAFTYDIGAILEVGPMTATIDYWNFDFKDQLTTESVSDMLAVVNGIGTGNGHCADPAYAAVLARISFTGAACNTSGDLTKINSGNILSYRTYNINGGGISTDGIDFQVNFRFDELLLGGDVSFGVDGTYLLSYDESPYLIEGKATGVSAACPTGGCTVARVGTYRPDVFTGYNQLRANAFFNWNMGIHNLRWQVRYTSSTDITGATYVAFATTTGSVSNGASLKVGAYWQHDITYRVELPWETVATISVQNIFDEDPPFAFGTQYNYDPGSGNPLGRVISVGVKKIF